MVTGKMKKKYRTLQRKLEELDSRLRSIFIGEDGEEDEDQERCRQRLMNMTDDIERRMKFLSRTIAAESKNPVSELDHHLVHISVRFDLIHSVFVDLKNNLRHRTPLHWETLSSSCSCSDLDDGDDDQDQDGPGPGPGLFMVYDNPLFCDDQDEIKEEEGRRDSGGKWRHMVVGAVLGGVTVVAALVSVVVQYGVDCRFTHPAGVSVYPTPT